MCRVSAVKTISKTKCLVEWDDHKVIPLYVKDTYLYGLKEGEEVSEQVYEEVYDTVRKRAVRYILDLLSVSDKTSFQVRSKLEEKFYPADIIEYVFEYMDAHHYIDDERYAREYIFIKKEKYSKKVMEQKLRSKGISREILEKVMSELKDDDEAEKAAVLEILEKKYINRGLDLTDPQVKNKALKYLYSKGFGFDYCKGIIDNIHEKY